MRILRWPQDQHLWIKGPLEAVADGGRRVCLDCGTPIRSYVFRAHPPESDSFERCISLAWCGVCRLYTGNVVHVPRRRVLVDALADLSADGRQGLLGKEAVLVAHLDRLFRDADGHA
ncbi:hypothetical protein [Streptomyces sp. NPDC056069]|uniref:hypothetical protein n=1 Tax=Streptomyces sp. NPDC056069 TaxID=3345702 RepID=UPI0035DD711C